MFQMFLKRHFFFNSVLERGEIRIWWGKEISLFQRGIKIQAKLWTRKSAPGSNIVHQEQWPLIQPISFSVAHTMFYFILKCSVY